MEDNWTPPSDAEVTDWSPPSDAQVVDETVKKKVTPSPSQTQSSSNGLNLLSGVIPSGKALLTGQKGESVQIDQKPIDLTNAPIAEDESTRTDKFIRKPIDKKKVDEIYNLSKQNESLIDEFAKSHFVLDNLSQTEAIKQLNDLYAKREQAKDPQTAQAIDTQIEVIKSQPVEKQPSIQEAVLQNAQKYGSQPQDFNRPEIPMNPLTPNQILERNGMKTANTVGELHDRYIESANKLNELRPELDKTATELDAFKKEARTADFKTDKSGNKTLEGLADIPEAFGHGFGGTMKSIEQGFVNLLGDKQDRIDYAKKRYLEDNILYPTRTKGMATSGAEMVGGVAPYVISTAVLPETALLGHVIINGLTMGASGYGNGYYEMFAKQKQQGVSDEEADAVAMQNAKFEGAKETAIGASLPFMGGAGSKLFLAPAEKSAMKQFLATQGVIIPTFTAGKLASNVYQKYGLGEKDVNLGDGLAETAENGLILGAMMEFAHKAPTKLKELYRANLSEQYPSIQQAVDKAVQDGVMDASQMGAFTEKLKRDYAVFNAMPKDITTEQKLAIEPEVKQIIELSSREPSAVESPEITKDKIVQLQKQIAEKLGTPLTEKEQKAYEKLLERQKPIKSESGKEITLELFPSEKAELNHYEKRIETAKENEAKLAEEKKVAEAEAPLTNVGVEEGSGGAEGDVKYTEEQTQEYKQRGFEQNDNGIWVHKGTNPVIKKVLNGWVGKLFASNGGTHAGNIHKEGSGIAGSLGKFNFKTGKTPFLDLVFGKDKTDSDYFVTLSHEMGHDIFERLTPEEKAIIEKNQNLTDSAKAHKENRDNKGELENNASDAEESWSDYVSAFLGKKLFDVAIEEYNAIPKEILPILEANVKIPKEVLSELGVEQSLKETTKAETPTETSIFDKYDLSTLENKPSERKKVIEQAVAEIKQSAPEKAERVREIMTNFDKLKTKLQGLDERVTKIKIEC